MYTHAQLAAVASCYRLDVQLCAAGLRIFLYRLSISILSVMSSDDEDTTLAGAPTTSAPDTPATTEPSTTQVLATLTARLSAIERAILPSSGVSSTPASASASVQGQNYLCSTVVAGCRTRSLQYCLLCCLITTAAAQP